MKKSLFLIFAIVLVLSCLFTSCESTPYYTVRFKGAGSIASQTVARRGKATEPTVTMTKPGFAFTGWTLDGDDYDFETPVTKDITLVAKWGLKCIVSFNTGEDGSKVEAMEVDYYTNITAPENPTRRGYEFSYWQLMTDEGPIEYNFEGQPVYESIELVAVWAPKTITVQYLVENTEGNTEIKTVSADAGTEITIEDFPSSTSALLQAGKAFIGWSFNGTTYHAGDSITVEANATGLDTVMTLKAAWKDDYNVGDVGPSGGVIIYKADEVQTAIYYDEDGNPVEYKWQYIESAPGPLAGNYCFGYYFDQNGSQDTIVLNSTAIGVGLLNTKAIVNKLGDLAYTSADKSDDRYTYTDENGDERFAQIKKGEYAAKVCDSYSMKNSNNMTYDDWILPSKDEFEKLYDAYRSFASNRKKLATGSYITSSEVDANYCYTAVATAQEVPNLDYVYFNYRSYSDTDRSGLHSVWPVRYF